MNRAPRIAPGNGLIPSNGGSNRHRGKKEPVRRRARPRWRQLWEEIRWSRKAASLEPARVFRASLDADVTGFSLGAPLCRTSSERLPQPTHRLASAHRAKSCVAGANFFGARCIQKDSRRGDRVISGYCQDKPVIGSVNEHCHWCCCSSTLNKLLGEEAFLLEQNILHTWYEILTAETPKYKTSCVQVDKVGYGKAVTPVRLWLIF